MQEAIALLTLTRRREATAPPPEAAPAPPAAPEGGGALWGTFDEEASQSSFKAAVAEWRGE